MRKTLPAVLAMLVIGIGAAAAQPRGTAPGQPGTVFSESEIREKLLVEGYSNVSVLKREGNKYSADAVKDGRKVSLSIDARTGEAQPVTVR